MTSKKQLLKTLSQCAFDPRQPGALHVIVDIKNADYFEMRATELITEARECLSSNEIEILTKYKEKMQLAISLLAFAMIEREKDHKFENIQT